ncbi:MAG: Flp pilus assembly protein CpaB, partial [Mesorhizobium sp.]
MVVAPPAQVVVNAPAQPAVALQDVLVLSGDVAMGSQLGNNISWEEWPADGVNANFI